MYYAVCCCDRGDGDGGGGGEFPCNVCSDTDRYLKIDISILAQRLTEERSKYESFVGSPNYRGFVESTTTTQTAVANGVLVWDVYEPDITQAISVSWSLARLGYEKVCTFQKLNDPICSLTRTETGGTPITPIVTLVVHNPPNVPGSDTCLHAFEGLEGDTCYLDVSVRLAGVIPTEYEVLTDCDAYDGDPFGTGSVRPPDQVFVQRFKVNQTQDGCEIDDQPTGESASYLFGYGITDFSTDENQNFIDDYGFAIGDPPIDCDFRRPYTTRYEFNDSIGPQTSDIQRVSTHTRSFVFLPAFDTTP